MAGDVQSKLGANFLLATQPISQSAWLQGDREQSLACSSVQAETPPHAPQDARYAGEPIEDPVRTFPCYYEATRAVNIPYNTTNPNEKVADAEIWDTNKSKTVESQQKKATEKGFQEADDVGRKLLQ